MKKNEILRFIRIFQSPSNQELFKDCACYWFAHILHTRFEDSSIVYDPEGVHFATIIEGRVYDISGEIEDKNIEWFDWEELEKESSSYSIDNLYIEDVIEECIYFGGGDYR